MEPRDSSNLAGAPRSVKAGVRADSSNEVAGRAKPETVDFSAPLLSTVKIANSQVELEVIVFKGAIDLLDEILSNQLFDILGSPPDQNILFKTSYYQKYFYLNLVDFLSLIDECFQLNGKRCSLFDGLRTVSTSPNLGTEQNMSYLKKGLETFDAWLKTETEVEHWYPNIDKKLTLKLSRFNMLRTCGNISKHTILRLGRTASDVRRMFEKSKINLSHEEAIMCLENFYEKFHDDILNYHASYIIEMLLNIRRGINKYLKPVYDKCIRYTGKDERLGIQRYEYEIPKEIKNKIVCDMFWALMNNVRSRFGWLIPSIKVWEYLKLRY